MDTNGDMQAIIDCAREGVAPNAAFVEGVAFLPQMGSRLESLEKFSATPKRKRGTTTVYDVASLNALLNSNNDGDITRVIYVNRDLTRPSVTAILNDHGPAGPGWRDFRVALEFRITPQWAKWSGIDGRMMPQEAFAEFIEDNLGDVADPAGATMLEIATYLEATRTTNFKSAMRLSSGAIQFHNLENMDAKVGVGKIEVPETITLGLSPFVGVPFYKIPARFRYRLKEGKLTLGIKLQRPEDMMEEVIAHIVNELDTSGALVVEGIAPLPVKAD